MRKKVSLLKYPLLATHFTFSWFSKFYFKTKNINEKRKINK